MNKVAGRNSGWQVRYVALLVAVVAADLDLGTKKKGTGSTIMRFCKAGGPTRRGNSQKPSGSQPAPSSASSGQWFTTHPHKVQAR